MARIRTIKPEFFTSEDIVGLSPMTRLLYIAVWCEADKEGRLVWKPVTFKLRYFPGDNCDIQAMCQELVDAGLVVLYGSGYAHIPTFAAHQHINPRESASQLPVPDEKPTRQPRVGTRRARVSTGAIPDVHPQVGREGKGRISIGEPDGFAEFWSRYPRKTAKPRALKAFRAAKLNGHLPEVLADLDSRIGGEWAGKEPQYIPHPATYLNDRRWEDAASEPQKAAFV